MAKKDHWLSAPLYHDWQSRSFLSLPPFARTKRKASAANNDGQFEIVPVKKFARDANANLPDNLENGMQFFTEDEEMEVYNPEPAVDTISDEIGNYTRGTRIQLQKLTLNGKECGDSDLLKNSMSSSGVSLILSNEVQETLARKQLNTELLLPMLINNQNARASSMALVVWKPAVNHFADYSQSQSVKGDEVESSISKAPQISKSQESPVRLITSESDPNFNSSAEEDVFMELDEN